MLLNALVIAALEDAKRAVTFDELYSDRYVGTYGRHHVKRALRDLVKSGHVKVSDEKYKLTEKGAK